MDPQMRMQVTMVSAPNVTAGASWCCYDIGEGRRFHLHEQPKT
jgi:hypothetical protein